jgi:NAD(P)-dependent dehydrogenase (short-subunit alcohol dehydrogenase family)
VALVDLSAEDAKAAAAEVGGGPEILPIACDITDAAAVEDMVDRAAKHFGGIDILLNNAASKSTDLAAFFAPFEQYDLQTWRDVMAVNLDGAFLVSQSVGRRMIARGRGGSVVNTASIYGVLAPDQRIYEGSEYMGFPINTPAVYSASKAGIIGLARYLAAYWAPHNIRVNVLTPGGIESGQNETFRQRYAARVPLGRMGERSDLYGALVFLASDASRYVTGQNVVVDGGLSCW